MKVLVVDDSVVFRSQIKTVLSGTALIEVVGAAANGKIAISKIEQTPVDLVTLDLEMPEMDGLQTIDEIKKRGIKTKIIVFASQTAEGADKALEALRRGANDFVAKPNNVNSLDDAIQKIKGELLPKILQFSGVSQEQIVEAQLPQSERKFPSISIESFKPEVIVIASSTGGPDALEKIFTSFSQNIRCPILIAQHMPPVFTKSLANRLQRLTGIVADEGKQWEEVVGNRIYVAPGDYHMRLQRDQSTVRIKLDQGPYRNSVRPAADFLFESAADVYGSKCMGFILTGMGEDGAAGAMAVKKNGGAVMIQNKESCVVFGMPAAVFQLGCYDRIGNLEQIHGSLKRLAS